MDLRFIIDMACITASYIFIYKVLNMPDSKGETPLDRTKTAIENLFKPKE